MTKCGPLAVCIIHKEPRNLAVKTYTPLNLHAALRRREIWSRVLEEYMLRNVRLGGVNMKTLIF